MSIAELAHTLVGPEDAPVIAFVNGLGGVQAAFAHQIKDFMRDHRVLTFDHRGMGDSPLPDEPATMETYVEDLLALLDRLDLERADLVGLSFGGRVLQELVLRAPQRVRSLVLSGTSAGGPLHTPGDPVAHAAMRRLGELSEADWLERILPALFGEAYRTRYPGRMRSMARWRVRNPPQGRGLERQWEAYEGFDASGRLDEIRAPVLVLHGTDDGVSPVDNAEDLADAIPGAELVWLEGVGHSPNVEAPERFNGAIRDFLRRPAPTT